MKVILTPNPGDSGVVPMKVQSGQCDCDCNCACPVDGVPVPTLTLPVAYYLELTPDCDNRCPGCGNVYATFRQDARAPLDTQAWLDLIARLATHVQQLKLTGGEPTLHPGFADIIRGVAAHDIPFTLFTNGRWKNTVSLLQLLRDVDTFEGCLISLHGPDAATHETFSGVPGSFMETIRNIDRATQAGLDVATSMVIHTKNWNRIEETLEVALSLGANHVVCNRLIGTAIAGVTPSRAQLRAAISTITFLQVKGHPIRFGNCIPQCFAPSTALGCSAGSTFATIDPWGRMRPCNHVPLIAGDLRTMSVAEAWHGDVMARWRASIPQACQACAAFSMCHGGCRAQAFLTGQKLDPLFGGTLAELPSVTEAVLPLYVGLRPRVTSNAQRLSGEVPVLAYRGRVIAMPEALVPLLDRLDGSVTLAQIGNDFGPPAVNWVGELFRFGAVTWA